MTRLRIFIVLGVAIGLGGTFALATYRYIQNRPVREVALPTTPVGIAAADLALGSGLRRRVRGVPPPPPPVVIAAADLALGSELRREDLRVIAWPTDALPTGSFSDLQAIIGRGLVQAVAQNEAILPGKLAPVGAGSGLPPVIPEGMRALSVRVND